MRRILPVLGVCVTFLGALAAGVSLSRLDDPEGRSSPPFGQATTAPEPTPGTTPGTTPFAATISEIDVALADRMSASWRPGCPVPLGDLRYVDLTYWGFDDRVHHGELVVHADEAEAIVDVFSSLFQQRFPIERMSLIDDFGGDDLASMEANNTSAFNCRTVAGSGRWSEHAYGRAIDINPVQNPSVSGGSVEPPAGARYVDRTVPVPGLIHDGDAVVSTFAAIGWEWGGSWRLSRDWQHFSATGV